MSALDESYWTDRYHSNSTSWDIGSAGPLAHILNGLEETDSVILIPGAGNAYEAEYALSLGIENIHILDLSAAPLENLKKRVPALKSENIHHTDFFKHEGAYDVILEQTFFCALDPELREQYIIKMHSLLKPNGILTGVMFDHALDTGPPFGGSIDSYKKLFSPKFEIEIMDRYEFSIPPRAGKELYVKFRKK